MSQKIAVSMIVLDEEEFIREAVNSCRFADYLCIVDGGSKDKTISVIEEVLPDGVELILGHREWGDHFGEQRQAAYYLVPGDATWWMRLDADEMYSGMFVNNVRSVLSNLPEEISAVKIRQTNLIPDKSHYAANLGGFEAHPRIFRHSKSEHVYHQWIGQVHEYVQVMSLAGLNPIPHAAQVVWNAQVFHFGWLSAERRSEREKLYLEMDGSGVTQAGDLTGRHFEIRELPVELA